MAKKKILSDLDLNGNTLINFKLESLSSDLNSTEVGPRLFHNKIDNLIKYRLSNNTYSLQLTRKVLRWSGIVISSPPSTQDSISASDTNNIVFDSTNNRFLYQNASTYYRNWTTSSSYQEAILSESGAYVDPNNMVWIYIKGIGLVKITEQVGKLYEGGGEIFNDYSNNKATGLNSHSEGASTTASGGGSHAEGYVTVASGLGAHAEGQTTIAAGDYSHSEGTSTQTYQPAEHAEGSFNKSYNSTIESESVIHSVGIGDWTGRKNAHEIKLNGDHYIYGSGGYDGTNPDKAAPLQLILRFMNLADDMIRFYNDDELNSNVEIEAASTNSGFTQKINIYLPLTQVEYDKYKSNVLVVLQRYIRNGRDCTRWTNCIDQGATTPPPTDKNNYLINPVRLSELTGTFNSNLGLMELRYPKTIFEIVYRYTLFTQSHFPTYKNIGWALDNGYDAKYCRKPISYNNTLRNSSIRVMSSFRLKFIFNSDDPRNLYNAVYSSPFRLGFQLDPKEPNGTITNYIGLKHTNIYMKDNS